MVNPKPFTCFLIGGDSLLAQCGEILLSSGMTIKGVISDNERIADWARQHELRVISATADYTPVLVEEDFDYLLSITHLALIPEAAIAAAGKLAVNFHDGPLPAYAGLNAPMWALMRGESEYAITWHVIEAGIDRGDILLQQQVKIEPNETALSLNTKCFAAGLESFPRLVDQLQNESFTRSPQSFESRTYYSRFDKPESACILDWNQSAAVLERMVRGLNVGNYANPMGSAKLFTDQGTCIVTRAEVVAGRAGADIGEVLEASASQIVVQSSDQALALRAISSLTGIDLSLSDFIQSANLQDGLRLPVLTKSESERLTKVSQAAARTESRAGKLLEMIEPVDLMYRRRNDSSVGSEKKYRTLKLREDFLKVANDRGIGYPIAGAFMLFLAKLSSEKNICIGLAGEQPDTKLSSVESIFFKHSFAQIEADNTAESWSEIRRLSEESIEIIHGGFIHRDVVARNPRLKSNAMLNGSTPLSLVVAIDETPASEEIDRAELVLLVKTDGSATLRYSTEYYSDEAISLMCRHFDAVIDNLCQKPDVIVSQLQLVTDADRDQLLHEWNRTEVSYDKLQTIHGAFEAQVEKSPDAIALVAGGREISYRELNTQAEKLAVNLISAGVSRDVLVGVHLTRSIELMVATIAVLKAGGAYVPLDPDFPADRLEFMIADSNMTVILTEAAIKNMLPSTDATVLSVHEILHDDESVGPLENRAGSADSLAYVIYTSGSTGQPKGVMIEHRNANNFFTAMDARIEKDDTKQNVWLAVTSLSFDISVLELFWTLTRGFKVVIYDESKSRKADLGESSGVTSPIGFGLFMWGNDDAPGPSKYRLLIEGSKFFDQNGFAAVWTPERHFHAFGGPYPNPAVTGAAIAAVTENVKIRSGSCVVPLHHSIRIAEEWAVVDNLSNGRVEIAAASGWNPNDFVLRPEGFKDNKATMFRQIDEVRRLWRGEKIAFPGPLGKDVEVQSLPRPVQKELAFWVTTAGNPETWRAAGENGFNVLTHLLGQTVEEVGEKIRIYREARAAAGYDPDTGQVAMMLHTYIGESVDEVRELAREPMKTYLGSSMKLAMEFAWNFPAFKRPGGQDAKVEDVDLSSLSLEQVDTILNFAFERYFETSGLFGDVDTCFKMIKKCAAVGVNEIACLLDFGIATDAVMDSLPRLKLLKDAVDESYESGNAVTIDASIDEDLSLAGLVRKHDVSHMQCTPSMARMFMSDAVSRDAITGIRHLLLGGEALPSALAQDLLQQRSGTLTNMYGPTETTIWSLTHPIADLSNGIPVGTPVANTRLYILDANKQPVPVGVPGELYIGGDGVARGYLNRKELTAERFVKDPFVESDSDERMYATGDLASYRSDGVVEFIGRSDFQVKVRGYRIELGEIESVLESQSSINEAAVIVRSEDEGDQRIIAFVVAESFDSASLKEALRLKLPEYMIPSEIIDLPAMPRTANAKLDRKALTDIRATRDRKLADDAIPASETEKNIALMWQRVLKLDRVGIDENFFDIGGHSLLVVQLQNHLKEVLPTPVSLMDLYQYPTIRSLSEYLSSGSSSKALEKGADRGARRRALRSRARAVAN